MLWPTDALVAGTLSQLDVITTRSGCCDQWMPGSIRAWDPLANVCARRMRCILVRVPMRLHLQYGTRKFGQPLEYGTSTTTTARRRRRITHVVFTHSRHRPSQASANKLPFPTNLQPYCQTPVCPSLCQNQASSNCSSCRVKSPSFRFPTWVLTVVPFTTYTIDVFLTQELL